MKTKYDVIVIGSGSAGFSAVEAARSLGARVCLIEKGRLGGECPNDACVPSKSLLHAARLYRRCALARDRGIELGERSFSFKSVMGYKERVVSSITGGGSRGERYEKMLKRLKVDVRFGEAKFVDAHRVAVGDGVVEGRAIVVATGASDIVPPIEGLERARVWNSAAALRAARQPKSLGIIGGGPVGCELATFFASLGSRVVLLQSAPCVLSREDAEVSRRARQALEKLGVEVATDVAVWEVVSALGAYGIKAKARGKEKVYAVEQVVLAAGKRPDIAGLGLENAGVDLAADGSVATDTHQCTNVGHIFIAGDADGEMMFTHTAHHEGSVAGYNAAMEALRKRGLRARRDERVVPRVTFLDPEVASVGMTQEEATSRHGGALVGRCELSQLGRALTEGVRTGFVKVVAHPRTRKLLGVHMIGERAGEVIHEAALAMYLNATVDKLAEMIHAYPTYSEGLKVAAGAVVNE